MNYQFELIHSKQNLIRNLKQQLEKHNKVTFSEAEFKKVLNILSKGNVCYKAKTLQKLKHHIVRDDNTNLYFNFLGSVSIQ
jgi:type I restriction enzyme R subunit